MERERVLRNEAFITRLRPFSSMRRTPTRLKPETMHVIVGTAKRMSQGAKRASSSVP